ncbi:MAG: hypothetical protein CMLOHMNK_00652 [Steroidobacteraceae bacterium]|nr:hypothetical protein [Steroidobacteraceae bacterium]
MLNAQGIVARERGSHDAVALSFAHALARELAENRVQLPGFPKVAMHVQRMLADEDVTPVRVVRAVGAEPVLAGRIVQCANSVIFNPSGKPVLDLRTAIARVGLDFVRTLTISFAVKQLQAAPALRAIEPQLHALWVRSVTVSTLCFVLARRVARINADTALLAGLLHGVGALYILTRAAGHPRLLADSAAYAAIEREWEAGIAQALLGSWRVSEAILDAIGALLRAECEPVGVPGLREVLRAGAVLERAQPDLCAAIAASPACMRLGLSAEGYRMIIEESEAEIAALRGVLGC